MVKLINFLLALCIAAIFLLILFLFNLNLNSLVINESSFEDCLMQFSHINNSEYAEGEIVVFFNANLSDEEIKLFIDNLGFESKIRSSKQGIIIVPNGEEIDWVCKLRNEKIVNKVNLNMVTHLSR